MLWKIGESDAQNPCSHEAYKFVGYSGLFIQEVFIECLVCAQHSLSYNQSPYGAYNIGFKIQSNKNGDGEV